MQHDSVPLASPQVSETRLQRLDRAQEAHVPTFLLRVLSRRRRWIVLGLLTGIALAFAIHQFSGPWHEATAQLLVLKKRLDTQPLSGPPSPGQSQDDYLPTHMLIISSPRVVCEAVTRGNLPALESFQRPRGLSKALKSLSGRILGGQLEGSPEWELTTSLVSSLKVSGDNPKPGLGVSHEVINVAFQGKKAEDCVKVLEAIITSYHDFLRDTYRSGSVETLELIARAREVSHKDLQTKETAYREFRRKTPLLWKGKDNTATTVHQDRLFNLDAQRSALRMRNAEIQASLAAIENALKGGRSYSEVLPLVTGIPSDKEIITRTQLASARVGGEPWNTGRSPRETLEEQLINLRLEERRLLKSGFGPVHPDLLAIRDRIEGVRGMMSPSTAIQNHGDHQKEWAEELVRLKIRLLRQEISDNERTDKSLAALFDHDQKEAKESILDEIEDESRRQDIERSKLLYESIIKRLQEIDSVKDFGGYNMHVLEAPRSKVHVKKYFLVLTAALVVGSIGGLGGACLAEIRDRSFRTPQEVCHHLGLPVLGQIPFVGSGRGLFGKPGAAELAAAHTEALRAVRTALLFGSNAAGCRIIQFTSAYAAEGKTTLAANLGVSIAQSGKKTLLIDADLRNPRLHKLFGLSDSTGLTTLLTGQPEQIEAILKTDVPGLSLLPSGPRSPNPAELLTSSRLQELLDSLRARFDYILMDTPPLMIVSDPCAVLPRADAVLLVIRNSNNSRPNAQQARALLMTMRAKVLGIVLNGADGRSRLGGYCASLYQAAMDPPGWNAIESNKGKPN